MLIHSFGSLRAYTTNYPKLSNFPQVSPAIGPISWENPEAKNPTVSAVSFTYNWAMTEIILEKATPENLNPAWDKFLRNCRLNPETGCVEWTGPKETHGYGIFYFMGQTILAHRMAIVFTDEFKEAVDSDFPRWGQFDFRRWDQSPFRSLLVPINSSGKDIPKITITHRCGNRACVALKHLEIRLPKTQEPHDSPTPKSDRECDFGADSRFSVLCREYDEETGCIEWIGSKDANGYGKFRYQGKPQMAHRVALQLEGIDIYKKTITRKCGNRSCVNPDHFEIKARPKSGKKKPVR